MQEGWSGDKRHEAAEIKRLDCGKEQTSDTLHRLHPYGRHVVDQSSCGGLRLLALSLALTNSQIVLISQLSITCNMSIAAVYALAH